MKIILNFVLSINLVSAATVSLQISNGLNVATSFAGATGSGAAGLTYGIIVGTNGTSSISVSTSQIDLMGITLSNISSTPTGIALASGNRLFVNTDTTSIVPSIPAFGADAGVAGSMGLIPSIDTAVIGNGDRFALVWFDSGIAAGTTLNTSHSFGLFNDSNFIIPSDGFTSDHSAPFAPAEPVRNANISIIPEPSCAILSMIGVLYTLRRKRL